MTSKLRSFEDTLLNARSCEEIKGSFELFVKESDITIKDKAKLIYNIRNCLTSVQLQKLFYNSLLKYEGLGVV